MNRHEALHIIKESGLVAEKMTDEEKAAKRKARQDARREEANRMKDPTYRIGKEIEYRTRDSNAYLTLGDVQALMKDYEVKFGSDTYGTLEIKYRGVLIAKKDYRYGKKFGWVVPDPYTFKIEHYSSDARILSREWNTEDGDNSMTHSTDPDVNYSELYRLFSRVIPMIDKLFEEMNHKSTENDPYLSPSEVREWDLDDYEKFNEELAEYARDLGFKVKEDDDRVVIIFNDGFFNHRLISSSIYRTSGSFWNHGGQNRDLWGKFQKIYSSQVDQNTINVPYLKKFLKEYKEFLDGYYARKPFSEIEPGNTIYLRDAGYPASATVIKKVRFGEIRDNPLLNLDSEYQPSISGHSDDDEGIIAKIISPRNASGQMVLVGNDDFICYKKNEVEF